MPKWPSNILTLACAAACLAGCASPATPQAVKRVSCYMSSPQDLQRIRRVVLIDLTDQVGQPEITDEMTESLFRALQGKRLFHVQVIHRTDACCKEMPSSRDGSYTLNELAQIQESLGCDAVLFGAVNTFVPYPRMQIGLYLRLLDLKNGKLVWGVDNIWDTRNKNTERRIEEYFDDRLAEQGDPMQWRLGVISPATFEKFVAYEVADTMPAPEGKTP